MSRLVSGTANGATQTATYDIFENPKTLGAATLGPVATTNRLPATLASYAANGAVTAYGGDLFDLDPFGMIQAAHDATYASKYWVFIYTADDERIWKYDMGPANTSWWKIRDLGGKVLSEYVNVGATWTAVSSYIYRDGTLLGRYAPGTSYPRRWFAVDHLGTPRRTFGENGTLIEAASYFPFGGIATTTGPTEESLRFTSHERDAAIAGGIDYMHARFYAPGVGRFLAVDPAMESAVATKPQSWNRFSYGFGNPLSYIDPNGKTALLIVGQPTLTPRFPYFDPFGHIAASAMDMAFSYGTQWAKRSGLRDWGVPLASYIDGAYPHREMKFYAFKFDAKMETAFFEALRAQDVNGSGVTPSIFETDRCASRSGTSG